MAWFDSQMACSLCCRYSPVVFSVADHALFSCAFSGGLICAWLVVFVHNILVSHIIVIFLSLIDFLELVQYLTTRQLLNPELYMYVTSSMDAIEQTN